jgi:hypothetical protein
MVPLGADRHELYCERQPATDADATGEPSPGMRGWFANLRERFDVMLRAAEEGRDVTNGSTGLFARLQARMLPWVAERIAEQRLLWNLRTHDVVLVTYPDDLTFDRVMEAVRQSLRADHGRHLRWLILDTLLLILSAALTLIPGPNVVAYYFAFRVVGHWLSMRGATQGLDRATWTGRGSSSLTSLRAAVGRPPSERARAAEPIARELGLLRLGAFLDRMLMRG